MYQQKRRPLLNNRGFTFVEALFQVVVFLLFSQFIYYIFIWNNQLNDINTIEEANWELFIYDFEQYFNNVLEISVNTNEIKLLTEGDERSIVINKINDALRMQRSDKGNVPLLIGIKDVTFHYDGNVLSVSVEFLNGLKKERHIFVQTR